MIDLNDFLVSHVMYADFSIKLTERNLALNEIAEINANKQIWEYRANNWPGKSVRQIRADSKGWTENKKFAFLYQGDPPEVVLYIIPKSNTAADIMIPK